MLGWRNPLPIGQSTLEPARKNHWVPRGWRKKVSPVAGAVGGP